MLQTNMFLDSEVSSKHFHVKITWFSIQLLYLTITLKTITQNKLSIDVNNRLVQCIR